jgi:lipopolysaccharide biosynthesis regulator YciM
MNFNEQTLLVALVAFVVGIALGQLWGRLTGRKQQARKGVGVSLAYILGLDLLASRQIDRAISELSRAARSDTEAIEIYLILGNLFREKGQLERAIQIHQSILHRPGLTVQEKAHALLCLGVDFKRAGFRDRAADTLQEVLRLDPKNSYALLHLLRTYEEEQNWEQALAILQKLDAATDEPNATLAAFLHDRTGEAALARADEKRAARSFETAIQYDRTLTPPYLHLGDLLEQQGALLEAVAQWETLVRERPEHAYLTFDRLERVYPQIGEEGKLDRVYQEAIASDRKDWRAHLALSRRKTREGKTEEAFRLLEEAVANNPHAIDVHLEFWNLLLANGDSQEHIRIYLDNVRGSVFFLDPHVCVTCHYRANGILWRCPHCQEWNTFVEERLASLRPPTG